VLGDSAPRLMGVHDGDAPALLFSALPGSIVAEVNWPAFEYELHVRAARLLRRLHTIPVQEAARLPVETRTRESLRHWTQRARTYLPIDVLDWAVEQVEAGISVCLRHTVLHHLVPSVASTSRCAAALGPRWGALSPKPLRETLGGLPRTGPTLPAGSAPR